MLEKHNLEMIDPQIESASWNYDSDCKLWMGPSDGRVNENKE